MPYILDVPDRAPRIEMLAAGEVAARNCHRQQSGYPGLWTLKADATADQISSRLGTVIVNEPVGKEKKVAKVETQVTNPSQNATEKEPVMSRTATLAKPKPKQKKKEKPADTTATTKSRKEWNGHSQSEIARFCGKLGFDHDRAVAVMTELKIYSGGTFYKALRDGAAGTDIPKLTSEEQATIKAVKAPNEDAPAPKAAKAAKPTPAAKQKPKAAKPAPKASKPKPKTSKPKPAAPAEESDDDDLPTPLSEDDDEKSDDKALLDALAETAPE